MASGELLSPAQRIKAEVQRLGVEYKMPAMFAAYQSIGQPLVGYAGGRRKRGSDVRVTLEDKIHLGSCTKAMTATMIARLIERGEVELAWDTTIEQGLPELSKLIDPSFLPVTLKQLLMHRGGCPGSSSWIFPDKGSITDVRRGIVQAELSISHKTAPGDFEYSNLGYVVASLMATKATGKPWEQLMREEVFEPLGLDSAGFGPPGTRGQEDQPWGHVTRLTIQFPLQHDNPPALGPAGTVHMSLGDWAKFCLSHTVADQENLSVSQKREAEKLRLVSDDTLRFLHTPIEDASGKGSRYAIGWGVTERHGFKAISHAGSNTMWIAVTVVSLEENTVYLTATTIANDEIGKGLDQIFEPMIRIRREANGDSQEQVK